MKFSTLKTKTIVRNHMLRYFGFINVFNRSIAMFSYLVCPIFYAYYWDILNCKRYNIIIINEPSSFIKNLNLRNLKSQIFHIHRGLFTAQGKQSMLNTFCSKSFVITDTNNTKFWKLWEFKFSIILLDDIIRLNQFLMVSEVTAKGDIS